ncbi:hypothetical protein AB0L13_36435 [Saccharopolyspora shandongensis]|uniref:hypothetical protein n=1 Tax=Saccharopolyspora shandongensis TaxID=418495 RepID=UPI0034397D5A
MALWAHTGRSRPPVVYHVHTLAPTLLRDHVPDPHWDRLTRQAIRIMDGHVYFGQYARHRLAGTLPGATPAGVAWLPTTIPPHTVAAARPELAAALSVPPGCR